MEEVKEGFLCPFCLLDMGTMSKLHSHFDEQHSNEPQIRKILRDVLGQAKKIVNKEDSVAKSLARKEIIYSLHIYNNYQELGVRRNHMERFTEIRNQRLAGFSAETNKLIIRLDKLLINIPTVAARKKLHEQTVVPWIDGEDVSRCPECTKSFHLARRKHHCRLCGSIMCNDCSCFLPVAKAKNMLTCNTDEEVCSNGSDDNGTEDSLRICQYCLNLLESRELMKASRNCKPPIAELYEKLRSFMQEIDHDCEMYQKMTVSLNEGKSKYNLKDAQDLWGKILKSSEKITAVSARIAALGVGGNSTTSLSNKELQLQKAVSMGVNGYIQTKILALPPLPSEELYTKLQENRRRRVNNEILRQKQEELTDALLGSQVRTEVAHGTPVADKHMQQSKNSAVDEGWIPDAGSTRFTVDDPIIVQINNIQSYIKQARDAYKFDEVASLEKNLQELQEEYYRQQS